MKQRLKILVLALGVPALCLAGCDGDEPAVRNGSIAFTADLPELYGEIAVELWSGEEYSQARVGGGECEDSLVLKTGNWKFEAKSANGFDWSGEVEFEDRECAKIDLTYERSDSTFFATYRKKEDSLPADVFLDGELLGTLSTPFSPEIPEPEMYYLSCGEIRRIYLEAAGRREGVVVGAAPIGVARILDTRGNDGSRRRSLITGVSGICLYAIF